MNLETSFSPIHTSYLERIPPFGMILFCLVLVFILGAVDHYTGTEASFSVFYLLPVTLSAWYVSPRAGMWISAFSAVCWVIVDLATELHYSHWFYPLWNSLTRFLFYAVYAALLAILRKELQLTNVLALTDGLTGLSNARHFKELAQHEIFRVQRHNREFSIAYLDLDNFKFVNDRFGHKTGDELLKGLSLIFRQSIRSEDIVARLGGDEFVILFSELPQTEALAVLERLKNEARLFVESQNWPVTLSIGLISYKKPPKNIEDLLHSADQLMYAAKRAGKNKIETKIFE